jgi:hypothetical protein
MLRLEHLIFSKQTFAYATKNRAMVGRQVLQGKGNVQAYKK